MIETINYNEINQPPDTSVESSVSTESSFPPYYAMDNPVKASLMIAGALVLGSVARWVNERTARDQNAQRPQL